MKKKVKLDNHQALIACKKCGEHFWPFYNFKEDNVVEKYCVSCKGNKSKLDDEGREIK